MFRSTMLVAVLLLLAGCAGARGNEDLFAPAPAATHSDAPSSDPSDDDTSANDRSGDDDDDTSGTNAAQR
jgi:hypothetical protein